VVQNLNSTIISTAPASLATPQYDRASLTAGIVHFGVGGFHRAHQAMYLDRLMNAGQAHDWAIVGVGVLPGDARMKQVMDRQDCLYTLTVKNPDGSRESRVIGSIIDYLFAPEDPEAVIEKMASLADVLRNNRATAYVRVSSGKSIRETEGRSS
jgi:mannitol 2-dehydrogenase